MISFTCIVYRAYTECIKYLKDVILLSFMCLRNSRVIIHQQWDPTVCQRLDTATVRCLVKEIWASAKSQCFYSALFPVSIYLSVKNNMNDSHFKILLFPKHLLKKYINSRLQKKKNCNLMKQRGETDVQQDETLYRSQGLNLRSILISFLNPLVYNQHTWGLRWSELGHFCKQFSICQKWPHKMNNKSKAVAVEGMKMSF